MKVVRKLESSAIDELKEHLAKSKALKELLVGQVYATHSISVGSFESSLNYIKTQDMLISVIETEINITEEIINDLNNQTNNK